VRGVRSGRSVRCRFVGGRTSGQRTSCHPRQAPGGKHSASKARRVEESDDSFSWDPSGVACGRRGVEGQPPRASSALRRRASCAAQCHERRRGRLRFKALVWMRRAPDEPPDVRNAALAVTARLWSCGGTWSVVGSQGPRLQGPRLSRAAAAANPSARPATRADASPRWHRRTRMDSDGEPERRGFKNS